jgi:glucans biosynthesis protein C
MIAFITNKESWLPLWKPMSMLNVWRIPLLFFVSGMGVYFASQSRKCTALLSERARRILLPYVAGSILVVPVHLLLFQNYYALPLQYQPNPGHLWFLGNIFLYVVILLPLLYHLQQQADGKLARAIRGTFSHPLGLVLVIGAFAVEAILVKPFPYELYAFTWHGFILGLLAFLFGYCFVFTGAQFSTLLSRFRWLFPLVAIGLFAMRLEAPQMQVPVYQLVIESQCWIFTVLAFGYRFLNRPSDILRYLSEAAYPVYIVHMIFLYLGSTIMFPMQVAVEIKFVVVLLFTIAGCMFTYEVIRRIPIVRSLFGISPKPSVQRTVSQVSNIPND